MLKVIELFAGLGSQTQALKNIGVPHEVVAVSEIDKYALTSYKALHGEINNLGDITKIEELPDADLWTYSFPCTDISVAGRGCGLDKGGGTRSGLLWEVERLLLKARETATLPKYLLLENVKNLIGHKHRANYDKWLAFLNSLGYRNYWQVLNAKHYGVPQNRERLFCVSILGDHEPYKFPSRMPLKLRLKDILETEVDEKYYLSADGIQRIISSSFQQDKRRIMAGDVCSTLCARDFKDPKCVAVGNLTGEKWEKMHDISRRVYDAEGIAPTIHCSGGGNTEPKVMCLNSKVDGKQPSICDRVYDSEGISTAVTTGFMPNITEPTVVAGQFQPKDRDYKEKGIPREEQFECRKDEVSNAVLTGDKKNCICIVAQRGRYKDDGTTEQRFEFNDSGVSNTLTTVQKDNLVYLGYYRKNHQGNRIFDVDGISATILADGGGIGRNGGGLYGNGDALKQAADNNSDKEIIVYDDYNSKIRKDNETIGTLTTNIGASAVRNGYKIIEKHIQKDDAAVARTVRCGGRGSLDKHSWDVISDSLLRIRKLTPRECLRLMSWTDAQIDKIQAAGISNSQQYKQAGNGIVVKVLEAIFSMLFIGGAHG